MILEVNTQIEGFSEKNANHSLIYDSIKVIFKIDDIVKNILNVSIIQKVLIKFSKYYSDDTACFVIYEIGLMRQSGDSIELKMRWDYRQKEEGSIFLLLPKRHKLNYLKEVWIGGIGFDFKSRDLNCIAKELLRGIIITMEDHSENYLSEGHLWQVRAKNLENSSIFS